MTLISLCAIEISNELGLDKVWITIEEDWIPTFPAVAIINGIKKEREIKTSLPSKYLDSKDPRKKAPNNPPKIPIINHGNRAFDNLNIESSLL